MKLLEAVCVAIKRSNTRPDKTYYVVREKWHNYDHIRTDYLVKAHTGLGEGQIIVDAYEKGEQLPIVNCFQEG